MSVTCFEVVLTLFWCCFVLAFSSHSRKEEFICSQKTDHIVLSNARDGGELAVTSPSIIARLLESHSNCRREKEKRLKTRNPSKCKMPARRIKNVENAGVQRKVKTKKRRYQKAEKYEKLTKNKKVTKHQKVTKSLEMEYQT